MRKAFTMLELVFVIVVIGILAATIIPNIKSNPLKEAAVQVISHIRYTQHLAMIDNKYNFNDNKWFRERWVIRFFKNLSFNPNCCDGKDYKRIWSYTIYSDNAGTHSGNPNLSEIAKSPLDKNKLLSGGFNNTLCVNNQNNNPSFLSSSQMNLGIKYGIKDIEFGGGCRSNVRYIYFDNMGRPFNSMNKNKPYENASRGWHKLLTSTCTITLCLKDCSNADNNEKITINITPETGYSYIN